MVVIILQYMCIKPIYILVLYTLILHNGICQLYLNEAGIRKENQSRKSITFMSNLN